MKRNYVQIILRKMQFVILFAFSLVSIQNSNAQNITLSSGAFIIDMGIVPQTVNNGLKPYGLIYDLIINNAVDVKWVIDPAKAKDGVDFVYNGYSFKGGPFIIPAEFRNSAVNAKITSWQALGVVGVTTTVPITVPVYKTLSVSAVPRWTLDKQNGAIAQVFFTNAGIPSTAYGGGTSATWKNPADLGPCDDIFVMPHANPTWATHSNLLTWNLTYKGSIWLGCTAGSALEDMFNPANPSEQTNFLSEKTGTAATSGSLYYNPYYENAMILWTHHGNGTPPYNYDNGGDPVMQFMGTIDAATQQGAEQIYLPTNGGISTSGGWRSTTKIGGYDPTVTGIKGPDAKYRAAVIAYGQGMGDDNRGMVMMEASHNIAASTNPANIAAQRAFFNFSFLAGKVSAPAPEFTFNVSNLTSGETVPISFSLGAGRTISEFNIAWASSSGGTFNPTNTASTQFTAPQVNGPTNCIISVTLTEKGSCGKVYQGAVGTTISCALSVVPTISPACYGISNGSVSMAVTGGDGNYTWSWSKTGGGTGSGTGTTISGLAPGTYSITITAGGGNGCSTSFSVIVNENPELTASIASSTNIVCYGASTGSISSSVTGGTPGYTYSWSGPNSFSATTQNISEVPVGTYNLTVTDAKGCTSSTSKTLTQPTNATVITPTITDATAYGSNSGAISLAITPSDTYTYAWSDGATTKDRTGMVAGTYSVTVTNSVGCSKTLTGITIAQPTELTLSLSAAAIACNGDKTTITATAGGGAGSYQYSLNGGTYQSGNTFSNIAASGSAYAVTIKDANNNTTTTTITVSQPTIINLSTAITKASCPGVSDGEITLTVSGGTPGASSPYYSYSWSGPNSYTSTQKSPTGLAAGTYTLTVTDSNGCTATTTAVVTNTNPSPVTPGTISK